MMLQVLHSIVDFTFFPDRFVDGKRKKYAKTRSGTIYIIAMGCSLIVACLAVAGLQTVRVQRRANVDLSQTANAKKLAQAGIEFVQHRISTDANWRSFFVHGVAVTRNTTGGSFSVTLTDPVDGIIASPLTDPVVVTCTGTFGSSSQKLSSYFEPQRQLFAACRSALYAPTMINFNGCTIASNHWAYSDNQITASANPTANLNCMAPDIGGNTSSYKQRRIQGGIWPMEKPDLTASSIAYVGKYYIDNAVVINASDLPTGGTEIIQNGGFETDTANWSGSFCTITRDINEKRLGVASCFVSAQGFLSTPIQNITEHMIKGRQYNVSFWIRTTEDQDVASVISLTGSGSFIPVLRSGPVVAARSGVWTQVSATTDVTWSGTLTKAEFMISTEKNSNYHFDAVSIIDAERQAGVRYIENVVLGSGNNPYGTNVVSTNGIYSINAGGEEILIRDSRINGTIVVQSASKVELANALSWEPSGLHFPALIANVPIDDLTSIASLSESTIGINANPTTAPYRGVTDTDTSDTYPSVIQGPIVGTTDILLDGISALSGPIIAGRNITVTSNNLNINFQSDMILNPPPGFFGSQPKMRLITSSVQTVP